MAVSHISLGAYFSSLAQIFSNNSSAAVCSSYSQPFIFDNATSHNGSETTSQLSISGTSPHSSSGSSLDTLGWVPLPLLIIFTFAFNLGSGSLTCHVVTELLPVESRRICLMLTNLTSNICWFVVVKTFHNIQTSLGLAAPFYLFGVSCVLGLTFVFIFVPETKGRTPQELRQEFKGLDGVVRRTGLGVMCSCLGDRINKSTNM